jgi:hypothetical protein
MDQKLHPIDGRYIEWLGARREGQRAILVDPEFTQLFPFRVVYSPDPCPSVRVKGEAHDSQTCRRT